MRNTKKWLVLLLTVVMLVNVLGVTAMATENAAPLALDIHPADEAGVVQVDILATDDQIVADGKLVVTYDPEVLVFEAESIEVGSAWTTMERVTLSHNVKDNKVILAFACADAANDGVLFSIRFSGAVCDTVITLDGSASYVTGTGSVPTLVDEYCPSDRFTDMRTATDEVHAAVDYMVANGYIKGMTDSQFGPYVKLDRAMMVTILHRVAGRPEVEGHCPFNDVPANDYYTHAVTWAVENGITNGISATKFAPSKALNRQELVTFLYRFADYMGYDRTATADLSTYTDAADMADFAVDAFEWAVAEGVIRGTSNTTLEPLATTNREQVVLMIHRLLAKQD
jgi:hypothetical protein